MKYKLTLKQRVLDKIEYKLDANFGDMTMPYKRWYNNFLLASEWINAFHFALTQILTGPVYFG